MNRLTRIVVATVIGFGLSRVMPPENKAKADAEAPELHPIVVTLSGAPAFKWSKPGTPYLDSLRIRLELDDLTEGARTDLDKVRALSRWVRAHNEPVAILEEMAAGEQPRPVEYAAVLSGAINSLGMPARVLNLKTSDSEVRASGAGHAVTEAYLRDAKRWVMVDGQYDVIPTVYGKPVSAFELKQAIKGRSAGIVFNSPSGTHPDEYRRWIAQYLHFMDARIDQRLGVATDSRTLMLIPAGSKPPRLFQRAHLRNTIYTTSPAAFYPKPEIARTVAKRRPATVPAPVAAAAHHSKNAPAIRSAMVAQPRIAG